MHVKCFEVHLACSGCLEVSCCFYMLTTVKGATKTGLEGNKIIFWEMRQKPIMRWVRTRVDKFTFKQPVSIIISALWG